MRKFLFFLFFVFIFSVPIMAAEEISDETTIVSSDGAATVYVDNDIFLADPGDDILTGVTVMSLSPVTPADSNGFKAVLLDLIGDYDPVIVEYEYQNSSSGYMSYLREIQPDYVWLCSAAFVLVVIYCLFRLGGAILCKR